MNGVVIVAAGTGSRMNMGINKQFIKLEGKEIIALNKEKEMLKKITRPDTLTVENALGKVWYAKSNRRVEFFTHHGIHPENGKTLREATAYMIEKYAKK
mgnify:CR=1 FL=1